MSKKQSFHLIPVIVALAFLAASATPAKRQTKCQDDECQMRPEHFKLYSAVKQALERDFDIKGKDLISIIRAVEVLDRRFSQSHRSSRVLPALNGTELVGKLLNDQKLRDALEVFNSNEGHQLINLYKTSINGNQQNLACSKWRVDEIEFAARRLERSEKLARVFSNIHKNFVERSARKCLRSSCSSVDDNMNRLDSVMRRSSRRKGFLAREEALQAESARFSADDASGGTSNNSIEEALIAQVENEPAGEFHLEELELCRFFKRTNATKCQVSGNELSEITFNSSNTSPSPSAHELVGGNSNETPPPMVHQNNVVAANLTDYLNNYQTHSSASSSARPIELIMAQCHAIKPMLDFHLLGLRWYKRQGLISHDKLRSRTFWCPSLAYWFEIERLCKELDSALNVASSSHNANKTFAY